MRDAVTNGPCGAGPLRSLPGGALPVHRLDRVRPGSVRRRSPFPVRYRQPDSGRGYATPVGTAEETPGYVIAGGENAAGPWTLELRPPPAEVPTRTSTSVSSARREADRHRLTSPCRTPARSSRRRRSDVRRGDQGGGRSRAPPRGRHPTNPRDAGSPTPDLAYPFDLFFASNDADVPATAIAIDANGEPIGRYGPMPEGSTRYGLECPAGSGDLARRSSHASDPPVIASSLIRRL